jgi:ubiquinone/menaquinone biosynthesis C-methylase UbiE
MAGHNASSADNMKQTIQDPEVLANHKQLLRRDAHLRRFGCDLQASIAFVLAQALPLKNPVLEIGTGKGRFLVRLARHVQNVTTVDISAEEQQSARLNARFHKVEDRIEFVLQDAIRLPWPDHSFDAVVTMNAMHHIGKFEPVLKEMLRVVKPGGKLVLADFSPCGFQTIARAHRAEGKIHLREPHSFRTLQQSLRKRGMTTRLRKGCNEEVLVVQVPAA